MNDFQSEYFSLPAGSKNPTIIIFSTAYLPMIGGAELAIKEITDRLRDDFNFILFTSRINRLFPVREKVGNVEVRRIGYGFWAFMDKLISPFVAAYLVHKYMKTNKVHVFWGMMATFTSGAPFLLKMFGLDKGVPILLSIQEGDSEKHLKYSNLGITGLSWKMAVPRADKVQVISSYLKNMTVGMGADLFDTEIIPNGVDLKNFGRNVSVERKKEMKIKLGIRNNQKIIITVSRLVRKNAVDVMIRAMSEIPSAVLVVAGSGEDEKQLKNLAVSLGVSNKVRFVGDVSHSDLPEYFAISHVFARPSRSEGLGSAFLEAMAAGLPVVATEVGGIPDFLENGKTGLFCRADDPSDLAYSIKIILHDRSLRSRLIHNAKSMVYEKHNWDSVSGEMRRVFMRLLRK